MGRETGENIHTHTHREREREREREQLGRVGVLTGNRH
jgi:hypothetical protein